MDYRPYFNAIRSGVPVPEDFDADILVGRHEEKMILKRDIEYVFDTNKSKIRIFLGDYGFGKTALAKHAISIAKKKRFLYSFLTEKDYKGIYKQDEFFKSIMKNLRYPAIQDPLRFILNSWAEKVIKNNHEYLDYFNKEQIAHFLRNKEKIKGGFLVDFCSAYLYSFFNKSDTNTLIAYLRGDKVYKRDLRKYKINHFLEDDGWNFLDNFMELMESIEATKGLLLVMDELENLRSNRSDIRNKLYNHLREMIDKLPGGEVNGIYSIWLGTREWFDDTAKGVKSYTALYERIKKEIGTLQTTESVLIEIGTLNLEDLGELVDKFSSLYSETYNTQFHQDDIKKIIESAKSKFADSEGEVLIAPRTIVKWLTEVLDGLKDYPDSLDEILDRTAKKVLENEDLGIEEMWNGGDK